MYNKLNLPISITKTGGNRIEYVYDANGNKLRQLYYISGILSTTTDFIGNFIYENGLPAYIVYDEGRVVYNKNGTYFGEIFLKDHLGNVRVACRRQDGVLKTRQVDSYYPFGMNIKGLSANSTDLNRPNEYLYNGKMFQDEMGLNWLDYGARFYDPTGVNFTTADPMAEERSSISPYAYCSNNPINRIDPDGRLDDWVENPDGKIKWDDKVTSANDKDLKVGDKYLGKNVLVGTHNRDAKLNEPLNSAKFELYLESNKEGPSTTIMGNTVPSDIKKSGTLAEGLYTAESQSRASYIKKGKEDLALIINGGLSVPTAPGSPKTTMSEIFFHMGNNYQTSLFDSQGHAYSSGCQTSGSFPNSLKVHNAFMKTVGLDFKGTYYLRATPLLQVPIK